MSRTTLRRWLLIGAAMLGTAVAPAIGIALYIAHYYWVPRYSAVAYFEDQAGFNLRLDFYRSDPKGRDSGRYLSVITSWAFHTFNVPDRNWRQRARTSVYRIDANHIAVLSPGGNDYAITLIPFASAPVVSDSGEGWQYLGAFEFAFPPGDEPRLKFFDQQLAECIPMGTGAPDSWAGKPRAAARRSVCPTVKVQE